MTVADNDTSGTNPLTEGMADYIPLSAMPRALYHEPLSTVDWRSLAPEMREPLLDLYKQHFVPTEFAVEIAASLQNAVRASLDRRNPLVPSEQRRINLLTCGDPETRSSPLHDNPASGGIIAAETGLGKTTMVRRALQVIAPEQFVLHGRSEACGWSRLTQVFYLHIDFPSNGSRGGLIVLILQGLDDALGTNYVVQNRRLRNLDASLMLVRTALIMHRVGVLVLDEMQGDNFDASSLRWEFVRFFLSLMNLGIPIVLCGHPGAFETLNQEGQVVRRFSDIGYFSLVRASTGKEAWWRDILVPGIMRFNLCEGLEDHQAILDAAQTMSAGIPGIFVQCYLEAQRIALRRGGQSATVTAADFQRATQSPRTVQLVQMARWIQGAPCPSAGYSDLSRNPAPDGGGVANAPVITPSPPEGRRTGSSTSTPSILKKIRQAEKRDRARSTSRVARNRELQKKLPPDDLRVAERALDILAGFDEHQADLSLKEPKPKPPAQ